MNKNILPKVKVFAGKSDESTFNVFDVHGNFIPSTDEEHSQMAAQIERACNQHGELLSALEFVASKLDGHSKPTIADLNAIQKAVFDAIKKATV